MGLLRSNMVQLNIKQHFNRRSLGQYRSMIEKIVENMTDEDLAEAYATVNDLAAIHLAEMSRRKAAQIREETAKIREDIDRIPQCDCGAPNGIHRGMCSLWRIRNCT